MKFRVTFLCSLLFALFFGNLQAQKTVNDLVLIYNISIESLNGEKPVSSALNGAVLTVSLSKDRSRAELVSNAGSEVTVYDNKQKKGFILKEYSGQKLMITMNADNWLQKNRINSNLNFKREEGTFQSGVYTAKKAVAEDDKKTYTVFYDPAVLPGNQHYNNSFPQVEGLPVEFALSSGNLLFKYQLTKVSYEAVTANTFEAPKSGFRVMTFDENQQLKKGD